MAAGVLAARAGAFPTAEGLEARPGAGRGALRAVGIGDPRGDVLEEPLRLVSWPEWEAEKLMSQIINSLICMLRSSIMIT